jgi:exopolysaccharide biosynthesis polyprenyl glycosylphosphotransferase
VEATTLLVTVCATMLIWGHPVLVDITDVAVVLGQAAILSVSCIVAFYYNDLYDLRIVRSLSQFAARLIQSFGVALVLLAGFYWLFPESKIAEGPFVSSLLVIAGLLLPLRAIVYAVMRRQAFADRVLILGTGGLARKLIEEIEARPHYRYALVGLADDGDAGEMSSIRYPLLGPLDQLDKIIEEVHADRVIVAMDERRGRLPVRRLLQAEAAQRVVVEDGVRTYEHFTGKLAIEALTPSFLVFSQALRKSRLQLAVRRVVSLTAAAVGLAVTSPLMALIALAIKLDSPGPIFFVHERAGLHGRPFRLVKFRTMHVTRGAVSRPVWERDDTTRITRAGRVIRKLRLDELPQFWNIVKGDMDLVGPRPEILDNVEIMTEQIPYYALRHVIRPGLTGWAQVRHGYSVSLEEVTEKIRHDLYYIKHMSLALDVRILIDTVKIVFFGRGAR